MRNLIQNFDSYIDLLDAFKHVIYTDRDHTYEINGKKAKYSVTKLLGKYKKPFDSDKFSKSVAKKEGVEQKTVLEKWDFTRDYANHKGTEFHLFVENYLERRKMMIDCKAITNFFKSRPDFYFADSIDMYYREFAKLVSNFLKFYEWYKEEHILVKSEFVIGDEVSRIAGTLDNLSLNTKTHDLVIFDYKTNKKIEKENKYGEKLLNHLDHLDNCELNTYALQLWLYKLIIERNTPFTVKDCNIFWFLGDNYEKFDIPDLKEEAQMILTLETDK